MFRNPMCVLAAVALLGAACMIRAADAPATTSTSQPATSSITGKVVDEAGKALADMPVTFGKPRDPSGKLPPFVATATTDKQGLYELKWEMANAPDGEYVVRCYVGPKGAWLVMKVKDGQPVPAEVNLVIKLLPISG